jgi:hypothetical protein
MELSTAASPGPRPFTFYLLLLPMYDPNWPQNGQLVDADRFRAQFAGIVDLVQAGGGITAVMIDGVTTGNPGDPATAGVSLTGATLHFTFGLPRGNDGGPGPQGNDGLPGPQGPPFAEAVVDAVTTLDPGSAATVSVAFDGTNVRFTFGIPRGSDGEPGPPGEISSMQLNDAIQTTSANSNGVSELAGAISDPPQQMEVQAIADKLDELILALRRT